MEGDVCFIYAVIFNLMVLFALVMCVEAELTAT